MFCGVFGCVKHVEQAWPELLAVLSLYYASFRLDCLYSSENVLHEGVYTHEDLIAGIEQEDYIMHTRVLCCEGTPDVQKIETLEAFLESDYGCALICTDCGEFEVYAKQKEIIEAAYAVLLRCGPYKIEYIDESNYGRNSFLVY